METKYAAEFSYGKPCMAIIKIGRETKKTYFVAEKENVIRAMYIPTRLRKDGKTKIFDTPLEAMNWLYWKARDYETALNEKLDALQETKRELEKAIEKIKADENSNWHD